MNSFDQTGDSAGTFVERPEVRREHEMDDLVDQIRMSCYRAGHLFISDAVPARMRGERR